jgi:hypothetical protein
MLSFVVTEKTTETQREKTRMAEMWEISMRER